MYKGRQSIEQPDNPTDEQRYELLKTILEEEKRLEDFPFIISGLSPPEDITTIAEPGNFKGIKVGILGGGLAGLASAFELRKLGFDITIYEALEDRVGGRIYTHYFDDDKKYYGELGAMRIPVGHESTWYYVNKFNLDTRKFVQFNENAFIYVRDIRVRNDADGKSVMEKIYPEFPLTPKEKTMTWFQLLNQGLNNPIYTMSPKQRQEIIQIKPRYNPKLEAWSNQSNREVMEKMGLSTAAINLLSSISPIVGSFLNSSYSEVLQENYTGDFKYLYEIEGGFVKFPMAFYNSLMSEDPTEYEGINKELLGKVSYKKGNIVEGIYKAEDNQVVIKVRDKEKENVTHEIFDYVICTLPLSTIRTLDIYPPFGTRKSEAIREVDYENIQKTLLFCKKRFWEEGGPEKEIIGGGSVTDLSISTLWYPTTKGKTPDEPGVLLATYNLGLNAIRVGSIDENRRIDIIKRDVEAVHGLPKGYLDEIVIDYKTEDWSTDQWFLGICFYQPGQESLFSYAMTLPEYNKSLFFAGVHVSTTHGWIQGALQTAMIAANNIAKMCNDKKG